MAACLAAPTASVTSTQTEGAGSTLKSDWRILPTAARWADDGKGEGVWLRHGLHHWQRQIMPLPTQGEILPIAIALSPTTHPYYKFSIYHPSTDYHPLSTNPVRASYRCCPPAGALTGRIPLPLDAVLPLQASLSAA